MSYIIGIDVGGTNTNAALLFNGKVIGTAKVPTNHADLLAGMSEALIAISKYLPSQTQPAIELHLSTTLTTNAIIEGRGMAAAALASPGPGMNITDLQIPFPVHLLTGSIDHRGRETAALDLEEIRKILQRLESEGIQSLAVVGKFSPRNPAHELQIERLIAGEFPGFSAVTLGHRLSGRLNFPRRIITSYLNAKVVGIQREFARAIAGLMESFQLKEEVFLLKADGGTFRMEEAVSRPVETILSGPAASVMGALSLMEPGLTDAVAMDIGGTTTEISVLVKEGPLYEREGAVIAGYKTVVPALFSRSVGLGGDSKVFFRNGSLKIGPQREGPAAALGGPALTPTDALVALGELHLGDRDRAMAVLERTAGPEGISSRQLAENIIKAFCSQAIQGIKEALGYLNALPVYTVSEVLAPKNLRPRKIVGMGGPAGFFIPLIAAQMGMDFEILPYHESANAIGAAASRQTMAITFRADTALGKMVVPEMDYVAEIPHPALFGIKQAREAAVTKAEAFSRGVYQTAPAIEITEEEAFNMVRGFRTVGKLFTLKAQVRPGVERVH